MTRFLSLLIALSCLSAPALAKDVKDDGGFGDTSFPAQAPAALGDYVASGFDDVTSPANIEPAAGDEEDIQPSTEELDKAAKESSETPAPVIDIIDTKAAPQE